MLPSGVRLLSLAVVGIAYGRTTHGKHKGTNIDVEPTDLGAH